MKHSNYLQQKLRLTFVIAFLLTLPVSAQSTGPGITGDWQVEVTTADRPMQSMLWLSADKNNQLAGKWISLWGASDLKDLKYEDNTLSFRRSSQYRGTDTNMTFVGQIKRGKLVGTLSRGQDESTVEGQRIRPVRRPIGTWDLKISGGEYVHTISLRISADQQGKLRAEWPGQPDKHEITDVEFKNPNLSFKTNIRAQGPEWDSVFTGQIKGHKLTGTFQSDQGNSTAQGQRIGGALVGRWELNIPAESGTRTQILRVYPDLTGRYGPMPIEKVNLEGDQVTFKAEAKFGERQSSYSFKGRLSQKKLSGELTSSRGTRSIEGEKIALRSGKGTSGSRKKTFRKPDVVFVPTPQKVVDRMLELAEVKEDDLLYDLGCGNGIIVVTAAQKYGCRCVGYDISAKRVRESRANVTKNGVENLVNIERADVFTLDLSAADVITLYLLPQLNVKLIPQLERLRPGVRVVSHDFDMEGVTPDQVITIEDPEDAYGDHTLYLWTTPLKREAAKDE